MLYPAELRGLSKIYIAEAAAICTDFALAATFLHPLGNHTFYHIVLLRLRLLAGRDRVFQYRA